MVKSVQIAANDRARRDEVVFDMDSTRQYLTARLGAAVGGLFVEFHRLKPMSIDMIEAAFEISCH